MLLYVAMCGKVWCVAMCTHVNRSAVPLITARALLASGWLVDFAHKMRYMASRNEYSKKRLGEISTAAYNTSLENTNYRNRYCN